MKKNHGVCLGLLAMGLAVFGVPASRAAGEEAGSASTTSTTTESPAPAASSPADLDRRIEALESELAELKTALAEKKDAETAAPAVVATPGAQDAKPADTKVTVASLLGPTSLSGFLDTYYQVNFNHPNQGPPNLYPGADFRSFDFRDKTISLNMIELILDKAPDASGPAGRIGYHFAAGYGDAMTAINATEALDSGLGTGSLGFDQYVKEAYGSYLAPIGKGLQFDVGKFVTPMGAEVIESKDNWNYSRGLLFSYAIPYFHFGLRGKYTFNAKYNLTGFVVNGWNNVSDNNSGKTYGFSFAATPTMKWSYTINYLAGPEETESSFGYANTTIAGTTPVSVNSAWRQTWDAVGMYTPNAKWSFMANYDYARGDRTICQTCTTEVTPPTLSSPVSWWGIAAYAKYTLDANDYFAGRYEYFADPEGFETTSSVPGFNSSATPPQGSPIDFIPISAESSAGGIKNIHYNEFTVTYQRTLASYLLTRVEYRRDMSNYPVYALSNFGPGIKNQNTASISMIFLFDSRNAK